MTKIYQVEITATFADGFTTTFNTHLFTDKEKAQNCVNYLYEHRFDDTEDFENPFGGVDDEIRFGTSTKKMLENGKVVYFELNCDFDAASLCVEITENTLDGDETTWKI